MEGPQTETQFLGCQPDRFDDDESVEEYADRISQANKDHFLFANHELYSHYSRKHATLAKNDISNIEKYINLSEANPEKIKEIHEIMETKAKVKEFDMKDYSDFDTKKALLFHSSIFYNTPESERPEEKYPEVWYDELPPGFKVVLMTPWGYQKATRLGNYEMQWMFQEEKTEKMYSYAEFNEGDRYPMIILKFLSTENYYTTVHSTVHRQGMTDMPMKKETWRKDLASTLTLPQLIGRLAAAQHERKKTGKPAKKIVIFLIGCMSLINASDEEGIPTREFHHFIVENQKSLEIEFSLTTTATATASSEAHLKGRVSLISIKDHEVEITFEGSGEEIIIRIADLQGIIAQFDYQDDLGWSSSSWKEKVVTLIADLTSLRDQILKEKDLLRKAQKTNEFNEKQTIRFNGPATVFKFFMGADTVHSIADMLRIRSWLNENSLTMNKQLAGRLYPWSFINDKFPLPQKFIALLHEPLPAKMVSRWNSNLGSYNSYLAEFVLKFHLINKPQKQVENFSWTAQPLDFSMDGEPGEYEGQHLNGVPSGWGRWKSSTRVIFARWTADEDEDEDRLDGLVIDISSQGFFYGRFEFGERDHVAFWRGMQDGEPRHIQVFYIKGKLSGAMRSYDILQDGKVGSLMFEEKYKNGAVVPGSRVVFHEF